MEVKKNMITIEFPEQTSHHSRDINIKYNGENLNYVQGVEIKDVNIGVDAPSKNQPVLKATVIDIGGKGKPVVDLLRRHGFTVKCEHI